MSGWSGDDETKKWSGMDIGREIGTIVIEPLEPPVPLVEPAPKEPVPTRK